MRFGQLLIHKQRCFMKCPKMFRGNISIRLGILLIVALSFTFIYVIFSSQEHLKVTHSKHLQISGHVKSILENTKKENADKRSRVQPAGADGLDGDPGLYFSGQRHHAHGQADMLDPPSLLLNNERGSNGGGKKKTSIATEHPKETLTNRTSLRSEAVVPIKCDPSHRVSEVLRWAPIEFLPEFKNPCWRERLVTPIEELYINNGFAKYSSSYEKAFSRLRKEWLEQDERPTYRLRCLPYFFLAGQPKCGSTDFYNRIISHPDVASPPTKESHWWGKNRYGWCLNYTQTIPFSDYVDLYDEAAGEIHRNPDNSGDTGQVFHSMITGDASVSTLWSNDDWWKNAENCGRIEPRFTSAQHIHLLLPQARIIVMLRNPTDRLYSDFLFFQRTGKSREYFHKEVETAINSLNKCISDVGIRACVYNHTIASKSRVRLRLGLYQVFLKEWMNLFPRNQIMVVRLEDYSLRPLTTIKLVHKFLDLRTLSNEEHEEVLEQPVMNTRRESDRKLGRMLPETRLLLDNFYRPYNVNLAKLLGDDRFLWN